MFCQPECWELDFNVLPMSLWEGHMTLYYSPHPMLFVYLKWYYINRKCCFSMKVPSFFKFPSYNNLYVWRIFLSRAQPVLTVYVSLPHTAWTFFFNNVGEAARKGGGEQLVATDGHRESIVWILVVGFFTDSGATGGGCCCCRTLNKDLYQRESGSWRHVNCHGL